VVQVERPLIASSGYPLLARIFRGVIALRWPIVVFYALLTVPAGWFASKVENDSSLDRIIVPTDPDYLATHDFQQVFGRAEFAVLLLESEDPLSPELIRKQDQIERALLSIPKLSINSVLASYREAYGRFESANDVEKFQKFARGTELFQKQGLTGEHFSMIGLLLSVQSREERSAIIGSIEEVLDRIGPEGFRIVRRVGQPYVNIYFDDATKRSGPIHFGLFGIFVVVLVSVLYRSLRTLIAFLITLGVSVSVSVGYIGITGGMFTIVSPMVPMTILITTTATLVYLHSRFAERPEGVPVEEHHIFALCNKFLACTASIFAAVVGFAALAVSDIRPIREMGIWVAIGLLATWVIVFTLFPALQRILKTPTQLERGVAAPWFVKLASWLPGFTYRWRWPMVIAAVGLTLSGLVAIFGLGPIEPMRPMIEPVEYISRGEPLYQDTQRARQLLPGLGLTHVWLRGEGVDMSDPDVLQGLYTFESALAQDAEVGAVIGLPTVLRLIRYSQTGVDRWPSESEGTAPIEGAFEDLMMRAPEQLHRFVDKSLSQTQMTVLSQAIEHEGFQRLHDRIRHHWQEAVKAHPAMKALELSTVGLGPLQAKMSESLVPTLVESFLLTAAIIFVTFLIVFRSGAARIMTMVPSLFAILVMFLVMRVVGMDLNIATILIASTVLGTSENDQIHFFYHFLEGRKTGTVSHALRHTFLISGRAIFFATIINAGGFLAFAMSEMRPMQQFGVLTAVALLLSMLADFTALPATLWIIFREKPDPEA
jgi:predicted RND superfamily exporter protein